METGSSTEDFAAAIYNAAWKVRYRNRGIRLESHRQARAEAIRQMGLVVREAFRKSEDFEALLTAVVDSLSPRPPEF